METSHSSIPRKMDGKKGIWLACLVGGLGLVLVIGCIIGLFSILGHRDRTDNEKADGKDDVKAEEKNEPAQNVRPSKSTLNPETLATLKDTLKNGNYSQTSIVGFGLGEGAFEELASGGGLLIGFELGLGNVWGKDNINSIRPIFLTEKGEIRGQVHGTATDRILTVKAKEGYAIGAVTITAALQVDGIAITFMRIEKKTLDTNQTYRSNKIGAGQRQPVTVGGSGVFVIGICGKSNGQACQSLGLVVRGI